MREPPVALPLRPELAGQALLVTAAVYVGYALVGLLGLPGDLRYLGLVAAFYLLPGFILRRDPERARAWQVGPDGVVPRWSWRGARWAATLALLVFPPFVLGFLWFYARVCHGDLTPVAPVLSIESLTPAAGGLERYLARLCRPYEGSFWPGALRVPAEWARWGGAGALLAVAIEVFAIALPEEVFHRGYLMSALEQRWPASRRVLGAPIGAAAVLASLVFALGHLVGMLELARLATFFPSLLFSWLWRRSGSLWAPALFHAAANLLMAMLIASTFP
ncbi:MAG: CPBP family intramembrane metalloprotease [Deltaproteobacteria bacterium]|nr:CPBP family intramembrane metalloprotease [Deltaproteobacteria bacterium]